MGSQEKIDAIKNWYESTKPKNFNMDFIESVDEQLYKRELSVSQDSALDRIISQYRIR